MLCDARFWMDRLFVFAYILFTMIFENYLKKKIVSVIDRREKKTISEIIKLNKSEMNNKIDCV